MNAVLEKKRAGQGIRIKALDEVEVEKEDCVYEVAINGLG